MKVLARVIALTSLISFAGAVPAQPPAAAAPAWVEGRNYSLVAQPQPTHLPTGKVLVTEVFSYACPACNQFRPYMQKLVKSRQESMEIYDKNGRPELAAQEREEIAIIATFLPQPMGEDEVAAAIKAVIAETGAASIKDMGKVIAELKARYAGKMDFGKVSGLVKAALAG